IFQPPQPVNNDGYDALLTNVSHNTAHELTPGFGGEDRNLKSDAICRAALLARRWIGHSSRETRHSSITGLVRTSCAIRVTSASASVRVRPPSKVISKYLPWRTS